MEAAKNVEETAAVELGALLDAGDSAVVTLVAGDTRLAAHRAVLAARSPVFATMFGHDTLEASSGQVAIHDVEGPVLRQLLAYLYTLQAPQLSDTAPQLLAAADKYGLLALKAQCEQQLVNQLALENAAAAAVLAVRHTCSTLRQAALTFIKSQTHQVMATRGWADAMLNQPKDLIEVSRLLYDPRTETSVPATTEARTATSAATATAAASQPHRSSPAADAPQTPTADETAISHLRSLSARERERRLIQAAQQGKVGDLKALLAAGVDVGATDENKRTALHRAAQEGRAQAATCLLAAGAQVGARDGWRNTPLHLSAYCGHAAVVQLLLASSADPNARDNEGRTPLHDAARRGYTMTVALLLEAGADRGARDDDGNTPLDLARQRNKQQLIQMLS